jgi:hypothetical protein
LTITTGEKQERYVAHKEEMRNAYIFVGRPEGDSPPCKTYALDGRIILK